LLAIDNVQLPPEVVHLRWFDVLSSLALVVADTTPPWATTASACHPTAHA